MTHLNARQIFSLTSPTSFKGRKGREGSISVTIVIIISWLVIGLVVYALAQFAILRRMDAADEAQEAVILQQMLATPPTFITTPPSPNLSPQTNNGSAVTSVLKATPTVSPKSIWLPSVGALQLSESSILKRRESVKRKRRHKNACDKSRIRHRSSNVDHDTVAWIEAGLDRVEAEDEVKRAVLLKWHGFLRQYVMRDFVTVS